MSSVHQATFDVTTCRANLQARQEREYQAREKRRQAALEAVRGALCTVLPRFPGVRRAYLFGSVLRPGGMRPTSDVDVAIEGRLGAEDYFALWRELERAAAGWLIEVVELERDLRFTDRVREEGAIIYERSDSDVEGGRCVGCEGHN